MGGMPEEGSREERIPGSGQESFHGIPIGKSELIEHGQDAHATLRALLSL
jgi:hypothetical protein